MSECKRCRNVSSLMLICWHRASIWQHCKLACKNTRTQMVTRQGSSLEWLIPHWASKMRIQECISKISVFDKGEAGTNLLTNMRNYQSQCHIWTRTIISTNTLHVFVHPSNTSCSKACFSAQNAVHILARTTHSLDITFLILRVWQWRNAMQCTCFSKTNELENYAVNYASKLAQLSKPGALKSCQWFKVRFLPVRPTLFEG